MLLDNSICQFYVIATRSESLSSSSQIKTLADVVGPLIGESSVNAAAFDPLANTDDA